MFNNQGHLSRPKEEFNRSPSLTSAISRTPRRRDCSTKHCSFQLNNFSLHAVSFYLEGEKTSYLPIGARERISINGITRCARSVNQSENGIGRSSTYLRYQRVQRSLNGPGLDLRVRRVVFGAVNMCTHYTNLTI